MCEFHEQYKIIPVSYFKPDQFKLSGIPTGNDVIREMNKSYGFFSWVGHGNPTSVATMTKGVNGSINCILLWLGQYPYESANGLNNMNN